MALITLHKLCLHLFPQSVFQCGKTIKFVVVVVVEQSHLIGEGRAGLDSGGNLWICFQMFS